MGACKASKPSREACQNCLCLDSVSWGELQYKRHSADAHMCLEAYVLISGTDKELTYFPVRVSSTVLIR